MAKPVPMVVECGYPLAPCGGKCGGEHVAAVRDAAKGVVKVRPCGYLKQQGWNNAWAVILWDHQAIDLRVEV